MNGQDKGLQKYKTLAMAKWVSRALTPHTDTLFINCNNNQSLYKSISPNLCSDTISGFLGPLAGLVSLMESSQADYLLISPCDTPMLPEEFGSRMLATLDNLLAQDNRKPLLLAAKDAHRKHPLHLCISTKFKNNIETALKSGERRVMRWINNNQPHWVDFSDYPDSFSNFNSLKDLYEAEKS